MQLFNTLADTAADRVRYQGDFVRNDLGEFTVGLCKGNGLMYRAIQEAYWRGPEGRLSALMCRHDVV
jgi:hypothetical protein